MDFSANSELGVLRLSGDVGSKLCKQLRREHVRSEARRRRAAAQATKEHKWSSRHEFPFPSRPEGDNGQDQVLDQEDTLSKVSDSDAAAIFMEGNLG